jgi:hypothetical protein
MHHQNSWRSALAAWLPLAVSILILSGLIFYGIRQNDRGLAYDPLIQPSEYYAKLISNGEAAPEAIVPSEPTQDLGSSVDTFLVIVDDSGKSIGSSLTIGKKLPEVPAEVLDKAKQTGQNLAAWRPQDGPKIAAVITRYTGQASGYTVVGKSLREVEKREKQLLLATGIAALAALVLSLLATRFLAKYNVHHHADTGEHASSQHHHDKI